MGIGAFKTPARLPDRRVWIDLEISRAMRENLQGSRRRGITAATSAEPRLGEALGAGRPGRPELDPFPGVGYIAANDCRRILQS